MRILSLALFLSVAAAGCGGTTSSPTSPSLLPSGSVAAMAGTWSGTSADTTGQETMTWTVSQTGNTVTAKTNVSDNGRNMMGTGTMQGSLNGRTMTYHMNVPNGGFTGMMSSCAMSIDGQATMSEDGHTMTGTYTGTMSGMMSQGSGMMSQTQSCGGAMNNGQFTLTR